MTTPAKMEPAKCPWCGGETKVRHINPRPYYVSCSHPRGCAIGPNGDTADEAVAAWNRVAQTAPIPPDAARVVERARKAAARGMIAVAGGMDSKCAIYLDPADMDTLLSLAALRARGEGRNG